MMKGEKTLMNLDEIVKGLEWDVEETEELVRRPRYIHARGGRAGGSRVVESEGRK